MTDPFDTVRAGIRIHPDEPTDVMVALEANALSALASIEERLKEAERAGEATDRERELRAALITSERQREAAEWERDDLKRRWEEGNTCGICPYRISIQARVAELEAALREIANRTHPATYLGKREDGVEMYGGSDDASRFARAALASGKPS